MTIFSFKMHVYSEDTDSFGIVHHANYIKFMERARLLWLLKLGFRLDDLLAKGIFFVIKKIEIDYYTPARLYDDLEIITKIIHSRRVAKVYEQIIRSPTDPLKVYCKANVHVVCVNEQLRPQPMPPELLESIANDI